MPRSRKPPVRPATPAPLPASVIVLAVALLAGLAAAPSRGGDPLPAASDRARRVLEEIDDLYRSTSSHGIVDMRVATANYTRSLSMEQWSKGKERSLVRILAPLKEQGTATLKVDNTIYTYLPRTDRTIRLTSSMMMGSWMGSHFTNDDLVKDSRLADDYEPEIVFEGEREGSAILEFRLTPRPDAPVVWGRIDFVVRGSDYLPLSARYYDEDLVVARTLTFADIKEMGSRLLPAVMRMEPADKPGEYTELLYRSIDFGVEIDDSFFSLLQLRRP